MNLTWFYLHCVAAVAILWADYTDRLEPAFNSFEIKMGLYVEPATTMDTLDLTPPFYLPPIDTEIDTNLVKIK